jgi:hypothetical protein
MKCGTMDNFRACPGGRHGEDRKREMQLDDAEEHLRALDVQR